MTMMVRAAPMSVEPAQHVLHAESDDDDEGKAGHRHGAADALDAVEGALARERAVIGAGEDGAPLAAAQILADLALRPGAPGPHDAVAPDQRGDAVAAEIDRLEKRAEIKRVDRDDDRAAEAAAGQLEPAGDLDRPFAGNAAEHRHADVGLRRGGIEMVAKMRAIRRVDRAPREVEIGRPDLPVGIDQADLHGEAGEEARMIEPFRQLETGGIGLVLRLDRQHDLVERGQGPADMLAEGNREIGGVAPGLGEAQAALLRRIDGEAAP
jgi:hypothetical protein